MKHGKHIPTNVVPTKVKSITIAIGADHRGFAYKNILRSRAMMGNYLITWHDVGTFSVRRTDYPVYAQRVVQALRRTEAQLGILLCGSGVGMAMAANRYTDVYAAVAWNEKVAHAARADDHSNVLVIPTDFVSASAMLKMVHRWLLTSPKPGRYVRRLAMID